MVDASDNTMVKFPLSSVVVPVVVPFTTTFTPGIDSLVLKSVIDPFTVVFLGSIGWLEASRAILIGEVVNRIFLSKTA